MNLGIKKERTLEKLVDAVIGVCEPENACEKATEYTRDTLRKRFIAILYPEYCQRRGGKEQ